MSWQILAIIAAVFAIGLLLGRGLGGGRSGGSPPVSTPPRLAEAARHEAGPHDVRLNDIGPNKINVIKTLRDFTMGGLKDTKDLVESAPAVVARGLSRPAAEALVRDLCDAGGVAELS